MAGSKLVFENNYSYLQCVQYNIYVFSMLSLGHILISDLVVTNLFIHLLPGMILVYLVASCFKSKVFLHEINLHVVSSCNTGIQLAIQSAWYVAIPEAQEVRANYVYGNQANHAYECLCYNFITFPSNKQPCSQINGTPPSRTISVDFPCGEGNVIILL